MKLSGPRCIVIFVGLACAWSARITVRAAGGDMTTAKSLYASASYEEALAQLNSIDHVDDPEQVEQYKALCLLALGRSSDAERALERIVTARPLFRMEAADVSPKLVTMYRDVRRRMLPATARELYTKAKASFEMKNYGASADQFKELLAIVNDAKDTGDATSLGDLKELGEGFLRLTQERQAATARQGASVAAPPPTAAPPAAPRTVFKVSDRDVVPPVSVSTPLPRWMPPRASVAQQTFKGVLEMVIDEQGAVESLALRESIEPLYDPELLVAAKLWRFRPAMRQGKPVRFMKTVEIVLTPPLK